MHLISKFENYFSASEPFFNPIVNICFVETEYLSNASAACICIACFYCPFSDFFRILSCFRFKRLVFFCSHCKSTFVFPNDFSRRLLDFLFYHRANTCALLLPFAFLIPLLYLYALFIHAYSRQRLTRTTILDLSDGRIVAKKQ